MTKIPFSPQVPGLLVNSLLIVVMLAALTTGCTLPNKAKLQGFGKGDACVNDTQPCISERGKALKALMADKTNAWIGTKPTPESYASGVRLFAFSKKKRTLNCAQLGVGTREAEAAPTILRGPKGKQLTPAQVSRGLILATEVARELKRESRQRCRGKS